MEAVSTQHKNSQTPPAAKFSEIGAKVVVLLFARYGFATVSSAQCFECVRIDRFINKSSRPLGQDKIPASRVPPSPRHQPIVLATEAARRDTGPWSLAIDDLESPATTSHVTGPLDPASPSPQRPLVDFQTT